MRASVRHAEGNSPLGVARFGFIDQGIQQHLPGAAQATGPGASAGRHGRIVLDAVVGVQHHGRAVGLEGASLASQWLELSILTAWGVGSFVLALRWFRWT